MLVVKVHLVPHDGGGAAPPLSHHHAVQQSTSQPYQHHQNQQSQQQQQQQQQRDVIDVYCGAGAQLVRWLAHAACARLAHRRGEALGAHVPIAVLGRGGRALDPDLVLTEAVAAFADGAGTAAGVDAAAQGGARAQQQQQQQQNGGGGGNVSSAPASMAAAAAAGYGRAPAGAATAAVAGGGGAKAGTGAVLASEGAAVQRAALNNHHHHQQQQQHQVPELTVVYGAGPSAFSARWDGRPRTPPFEWDAAARRARPPPHDAWLAALDPDAEGLGALQDPELLAAAPRGAGAADLARTKGVLVEHAGALQALFLVAAADAATPPEALGRVTLAQLKALLVSARIVAGSKGGGGGSGGGGGAAAGAPPDTADRAYAAALATPRALARKAEDGGAPPGLDLPDFMVALAHVAHARYAAGSFSAPAAAAATAASPGAADAGAAAAAAANAAAAAPLATKLLSLVHDGLGPTAFSDLARRVERIAAAAAAPNAALLMRKARSLTERALDRCQLRRVRAQALRVDLRHVLVHLGRWGVLGRELALPDLVPAAVYALQPRASDPLRFELLPQPLAVDHAAFERLLLGAAHVLWRARRRTGAAGGGGDGGFEPALAEFLETVLRRAGVLAEPPPPPSPSMPAAKPATEAAAAVAAATGLAADATAV